MPDFVQTTTDTIENKSEEASSLFPLSSIFYIVLFPILVCKLYNRLCIFYLKKSYHNA